MGKKSFVIDASVFLSAFLDTETFHRQSRDLLLNLNGSTVHLCSFALWEIAAALYRRTADREGTDRAMKLIIKLVTDHHLFDSPSCQFLFPDLLYRTGLRAADCVYVSLALHTKSTLITLDEEMIKRSQGIVQVFRPESAFELPFGKPFHTGKN